MILLSCCGLWSIVRGLLLKNKEYFAKNVSITEGYHFTSKIINYFAINIVNNTCFL